MKLVSKIAFLIILVVFAHCLFFSFVGCSPKNKEDLAGTWKMTAYRVNHNPRQEDIKVTWNLKENGSLEQEINYSGQVVKESAHWKLLGDTALQIVYPGKQTEVIWRIVSLATSSMSLEYTIPGFFVERSFEKTHEYPGKSD